LSRTLVTFWDILEVLSRTGLFYRGEEESGRTGTDTSRNIGRRNNDSFEQF